MEIKRYLERIRYDGELTPTLEVLTGLQQAHLLNVPFENLDIYNKTRIDLAESYKKIVIQNRGGFCYELNGLFYRLLKELGFKVRLVSARVYNNEKGYGPEFDHMAILATFGKDDYLTDVGFGEFAFHPLKIERNSILNDPRAVFRIERYDRDHLVVKKKVPDENFLPEYLFSEKERELNEFYDMCRYHQTSPESHFTQKRICSLATKEGRITLTGNTLKITVNGKITEKQLASETEVQQALLDHFKIKITHTSHR